MRLRWGDAKGYRLACAGLLEGFARAVQPCRPGDLVVVFVAGHGVVLGGEYQFLTPVAGLDELPLKRGGGIALTPEAGARLAAAAVPWGRFQAIASLPCRKLFLLDTCHAGAVRPLLRHDVFVLASAAEDQEAFEKAALGHGAFTAALLDGLRGAADRNGDGVVDLAELGAYVDRAVRKTTDNLQTPRAWPAPGSLPCPVPLTSAAARNPH